MVKHLPVFCFLDRNSREVGDVAATQLTVDDNVETSSIHSSYSGTNVKVRTHIGFSEIERLLNEVMHVTNGGEPHEQQETGGVVTGENWL